MIHSFLLLLLIPFHKQPLFLIYFLSNWWIRQLNGGFLSISVHCVWWSYWMYHCSMYFHPWSIIKTGKKDTYRGTETSVELNFTKSEYNNTVYNHESSAIYILLNVPGTFSTRHIKWKKLQQEFPRPTRWSNRLIAPLLFTLHVFLHNLAHSKF